MFSFIQFDQRVTNAKPIKLRCLLWEEIYAAESDAEKRTTPGYGISAIRFEK